MKTSAFLALSVALSFAAATVSAQSESRTSRIEPLRVVSQRDLPIFPPHLMQLGMREGMARIAFSVNAEGRMDDCLAVAYTHPEFAEASAAAIKRWRFEPASDRGELVAAVSEVTFTFQVEGPVVVSMTPNEMFDVMIYSIKGADAAFRPRVMSELDQVPTPVTVVSPRYPFDLARRIGSGHVTVQFYIDETGAVRLPCVNAGADSALASLAVAAMQQWRFEPPTCGGRPVLVEAEQRFNFTPQTFEADAPGV
jgi:TonB family protein